MLVKIPIVCAPLLVFLQDLALQSPLKCKGLSHPTPLTSTQEEAAKSNYVAGNSPEERTNITQNDCRLIIGNGIAA